MLQPDFLMRLKQHNVINKPIKNIIFDLGNVVIHIDPDLTIQKFKSMGIPDFDSLYTIMRQSDIFDRLDTGKTTLSAFRNTIRSHSKTNLTDQQIDEAWCAMLLDFPEENIRLLQRLRPHYKLFLLSNTNQIHIDYYLDKLQKEKGSALIPDLFDHAYYSHEIGFRKPHREAFDYVLKAESLKPAETLFIDDLEHNVIGARKAGMQAYLHPRENRLADLFVNE